METSIPSNESALLPYLHSVAARRHLDSDEAREAMRIILNDGASDAQIAAFLIALHMKGETAGELAGFARAIREQSLPFPFQSAPGLPLLDTCGTGGDGLHTFNISTTVAFVVAGCGVPVAKHGNRGISSLSGSADVLEHLGVSIALSGEQAAQTLRDAGICFLFAPAFHPALRAVQSVRRQLKMRTAFNLLGPLSSPARTTAQLVGAPSLHSAERVAGALAHLALESGYVVHGEDGLDEVTLTGSTAVFSICGGAVERSTVHPEDFGLERATMAELQGGAPPENAEITRSILSGAKGPRRDIVLANAAMGLLAARQVESMREGVDAARASIDSGAARRALLRLSESSKDYSAPL